MSAGEEEAEEGTQDHVEGTAENNKEEWCAYEDDEGRTYYYNQTTGETSWTLPEGTNVVSAEAPAEEEGGEAEVAAETTEEGGEAEGEGGEEEGEGGWVAYKDEEGREYYYNTVTGATQWEKPEGFVRSEAADEEAEVQEEAYEESMEEERLEPQEEPPESEKEEAEPPEEAEPEPEPEPEIDPVTKAINLAESKVSSPDAVLEPECLKHVGELVTHLGPEIGGPKAMQHLVSSFHGHSAICGQLAMWLSKLSSINATPSSGGISPSDPFVVAADAVRSTSQDIVHKIAMERFTKQAGDDVLKLSKAEATFLEQMMESPVWRRLLIDLSATHKDSALLMYCLQSISKRGHHREIAKRINQSDYFSVFNGMLASELAALAKLGIGGHIDHHLPSLLQDFMRTSQSTSYTYMYASELIQQLIQRASLKKLAPEGHRYIGLRRAIRKWETLGEDLQDEMISPQSTENLSFIVKRRRVDATLTLSDLYLRQRKKPFPDNHTSMDNNVDPTQSQLDTALISLLKAYSLNKPLDDTIARPLLQHISPTPKSLRERDRLGNLLLEQTSAMSFLLGNLFKPSANRLRSLEMRGQCAKLVVLAVLAGRRSVKVKEEDLEDGEVTIEADLKEEEELNKIMLEACRYCEEVENMVSFTVSDDAEMEENASVGRKLTFLCKKHAPVAQGVLMWVKELISGPEFVNSAAYATLVPCLLSLIRIIGTYHPFSREKVLDLALRFLHHSNPDLSYQKVQALKQQVLRLLLTLCTQGQVLAVFTSLTRLLQSGDGGTDIDSALLRYFIKGCLEIIQPPLTIPLVEVMAQMLVLKPCLEALRSSYFDVGAKAQLRGLMELFGRTVKEEKRKESLVEDVSLVPMLISLYAAQ